MNEQLRLNEGEKIIICAFNDSSQYPIYYKTFDSGEEAYHFYFVMLKSQNIQFIVTRVFRNPNKKP
jgi:hypothetical protein